MLPPEQIENIKEQFLSQLEQTNLPNKEEIKQSIKAMNPKELEEFLKQNNLIKDQDVSSSPQPLPSPGQQCIFCSISKGEVESYKIDENKNSLAVLELNPATKGHILIIPKKHISSSNEIPQTAFSLAKKIAKKLKTKLKAKDVSITTSNIFGHEIIQVIPQHKDQELNKKHQATQEELQELQKLLEKKPKPKSAKPKTKKVKEKKLWLPRRIP